MLGIYVHIPFCKRICNYCDFCKILYNDKYIGTYLDNLEKEIKERYKGETAKTIYIGGGTPSGLKTGDLDRLLYILSNINLDSEYEYTIECNVCDIDIDKINLFKSYGINRISVGVESFNQEIGKILGREIDEGIIFDKIYLLKKYFDNISIDLIYGVTSDVEKVKNDINKFLKLDIPHVSCYSLILEEHTKLYIDNYVSINQDIDYKMYKYINDTLSNSGFNHYEVSNYAKPRYESIHNKNYWLNGEYYGFGLGAVSYLDNRRITNTRNLSQYLKGTYLSSTVYEDMQVRKENALILGLRLIKGINIDDYNHQYDTNLLKKPVIMELIKDDYLVVEEGNIRCNNKYLYLENSILEKIIGSNL